MVLHMKYELLLLFATVTKILHSWKIRWCLDPGWGRSQVRDALRTGRVAGPLPAAHLLAIGVGTISKLHSLGFVDDCGECRMLVAIPQRGRSVPVDAVNTVSVKVLLLLLIVVQSVDHVVMVLLLLLLVDVSVASDQMLVLVLMLAMVMGRTVVVATVVTVISVAGQARVIVVVFVLLEELCPDRANRVFAGVIGVVAGAEDLLLLDAVSRPIAIHVVVVIVVVPIDEPVADAVRRRHQRPTRRTDPGVGGLILANAPVHHQTLVVMVVRRN